MLIENGLRGWGGLASGVCVRGGGKGMASLCVCVGRDGGWAEIFHYNGGLGWQGGGGRGGGRCFSIEWYRIEGEGNNKYVDNNR